MKTPNKATVAIIKKAVKSALPKGREFKILLDPTSIKGRQQLPDNLKYLKKVKIFSLFSSKI